MHHDAPSAQPLPESATEGNTPRFALAPALSREFLLHHRLCPRSFAEDGSVVVAKTPDALCGALEDIGQIYQRQCVVETVPRDELEQLIERLTTRSGRDIELARADLAANDLAFGNLAADVRDLANQPPVIRYVNLLVREAYDAAASDVHLETTPFGLSVRFRIDGVLAAAPEPPQDLHQAVLSRIKLLADLDIAERRRPQDGRIRVRLEARELDIRVSTVPTMLGESVVLRLLDQGGRPVTLTDLGMSDEVLATVRQLAARPHGMLLATGPTGSGKTTSLYAALQQRNALVEKIITVEDPIEYQLAGITQMPVHRESGVTFGSALRAILRQDPDVVMIGEMRDEETAAIAVQAAMTGHLVLSTLHTNDAIGAIARLLDLGIPDYLVAATLQGVLAQRLVRRICDECGGARCARCRGSGLRGRVGIFELLIVTDDLREAIATRASSSRLRAIATESGFLTLRADGSTKVARGLTTTEEIARVVES
jgi:general secretion pathway protein E